jgi:surfeit locus 1 family protein
LSPQAAKPRAWRGLLIPAAFLFAVLIALGSWQIQRKTWKEGVIAALNDRLAAPPLVLPAPSAWPSLHQASDEYRRVTFSAEFDHGREALIYAAPSAFRPEASGPGFWIFTPARLAGGGVVIVNRGFVPQAHREGAARASGQVAGRLEIVGALRWPERRTWFSPSDDPDGNLWFTRDPRAIAAAKGLGKGLGNELGNGLGSVAPFYVEQEGSIPPGGLPRPGKIVANLRNEHLQYAFTWFGLAVVLLVAFGVWAFNSSGERLRRNAPQPP